MPSFVPADERARLAHDLQDQFGTLLASLRMDIAWLDRSLAEQAGSSGDAVRTLRMEMRIRCDGMEDQLGRLALNLACIVNVLNIEVLLSQDARR